MSVKYSYLSTLNLPILSGLFSVLFYFLLVIADKIL